MKTAIGTVGVVIVLAFVATTLWAETMPTVGSDNTAPISAELAKSLSGNIKRDYKVFGA
jgi:hypothetical protein